MPLPGDLTTFSLEFGPYTDAQGLEALVAAGGKLLIVNPANNKRIKLLHAASGQVILPVDVPIVIDEEGTGLLEGLPHTGQAGLSPTGWAYRVEWNIPTGPRYASPGALTFLVDSGPTVDFDELVPAPNLPTVSVPIAVSAQALIGVDTDGVPFYDPAGVGEPAGMAVDLDGVPYFSIA